MRIVKAHSPPPMSPNKSPVSQLTIPLSPRYRRYGSFMRLVERTRYPHAELLSLSPHSSPSSNLSWIPTVCEDSALHSDRNAAGLLSMCKCNGSLKIKTISLTCWSQTLSFTLISNTVQVNHKTTCTKCMHISATKKVAVVCLC